MSGKEIWVGSTGPVRPEQVGSQGTVQLLTVMRDFGIRLDGEVCSVIFSIRSFLSLWRMFPQIITNLSKMILNNN